MKAVNGQQGNGRNREKSGSGTNTRTVVMLAVSVSLILVGLIMLISSAVQRQASEEADEEMRAISITRRTKPRR